MEGRKEADIFAQQRESILRILDEHNRIKAGSEARLHAFCQCVFNFSVDVRVCDVGSRSSRANVFFNGQCVLGRDVIGSPENVVIESAVNRVFDRLYTDPEWLDSLMPYVRPERGVNTVEREQNAAKAGKQSEKQSAASPVAASSFVPFSLLNQKNKHESVAAARRSRSEDARRPAMQRG